MHPVLLGEIAEDHVRSLIHQAEAARLARSAAAGRPHLRRRLGLRLIAAGERLASPCPQRAVRAGGSRL